MFVEGMKYRYEEQVNVKMSLDLLPRAAVAW